MENLKAIIIIQYDSGYVDAVNIEPHIRLRGMRHGTERPSKFIVKLADYHLAEDAAKLFSTLSTCLKPNKEPKKCIEFRGNYAEDIKKELGLV